MSHYSMVYKCDKCTIWDDYSHRGAALLVGYLSSHTQHALVKLLNTTLPQFNLCDMSMTCAQFFDARLFLFHFFFFWIFCYKLYNLFHYFAMFAVIAVYSTRFCCHVTSCRLSLLCNNCTLQTKRNYESEKRNNKREGMCSTRNKRKRT